MEHMSTLTREDLLKLARLSRLRLTDAELDIFAVELTKILDYVRMLDDVDVGELKPTYQVTGLENVTRPDEIKDYRISQAELLKNVPAVEADQIKVKRILE